MKFKKESTGLVGVKRITKDQLISKCLFGVVVSTKIPNEMEKILRMKKFVKKYRKRAAGLIGIS